MNISDWEAILDFDNWLNIVTYACRFVTVIDLSEFCNHACV